MGQILRAFRAWPLAATLAVCAPAELATAQGALPPRWTLGVDAGVMLPAWIYNEQVTAFINDSLSLPTSYSERMGTAPVIRAMLRYQPQSDFGAFLGVEHSFAGTTATFLGGGAGRQEIERDVRIWIFGAGMSVQVGEWADGGGSLEYLIGPVLAHHTLDLSNGHRDVFARAFGAQDTVLRWTRRSWTGWGFLLGVSARFPIASDLGLRIGAQNIVMPVATEQIASQDEEDVLRLAGRAGVFSYRAYTTYYPSVRVGLEYVLGRTPPRFEAVAALPPPPGPAEASAETRAARAMVARGDTAGAIVVLRERVVDAPGDASAWRDLALLLAAGAEHAPALRAEAWQALQRAVALNPDDTAVLAAYGRVRALVRGAEPRAAPPVPLSLSGIAVMADAAGGVSVAWRVAGLQPAENGRARYRVRVEVVDDAGERVLVRLAAEPAGEATARLELEREAGPAADERLELRLARVRPGVHTLRVRITDLESGWAVTGVAGFEVP